MQGLRKGVVWLLMVAGLLVIAPAVSGQQLREEIGGKAFSLRGIESMDFMLEKIDADAAKAIGLTERQLQTDVELKMRTAGVKLDDSVRPYLYLNVSVLHDPEQQDVAFSIALKFKQWGTFDGGFRGLGTTWDTGAIGTVGETMAARNIRESVGDYVDQFLNDYLKANPRH
jgi:hypothetical protein